MGLSPADTVRQCLRLGLKDQAHKLARELKVGGCGRVGGGAGKREDRQHHQTASPLTHTHTHTHALRPCCAGRAQMPEKQLLLLSAQTHAAARDWSALQHMAGKLDRRSPLTMEAVVGVARWGVPVGEWVWGGGGGGRGHWLGRHG